MISRAISSIGTRFVVNDFTMRVNDGAPIALPFRPLAIRAGRNEIVCVPGEDADESAWGGKTYVVTAAGEPIEIATWRARGYNPVGISDDGSRVWLIGRESATYYTWQKSSGLEGPFDTPNPDNHQGFATVEPLRMHTPFALTKLGSVALRFPLKLWIDLGQWLFGEHKDVWYAYRKADAAWFVVYDGPVTVAHTARMIDGQMVAAVNGEAGGFVRESHFRRVEDAPPVTFKGTLAGVAVFGDVDPKPRIIGVGETPSSSTELVLYTIGGTTSRDESKALADTIDRACLVYMDKHGLTPSHVPDGFWGLIYGYATPGKSLDWTATRVEGECRAFRDAKKPFGLNLGLYRMYRGPGNYPLSVEQVLRTAERVWDIGREYGASFYTVFAKERHDDGQLVDGIDHEPKFQQAWRAMRVASGGRFPRPTKATTPTPPTPQPIPMTPDRFLPELQELFA